MVTSFQTQAHTWPSMPSSTVVTEMVARRNTRKRECIQSLNQYGALLLFYSRRLRSSAFSSAEIYAIVFSPGLTSNWEIRCSSSAMLMG